MLRSKIPLYFLYYITLSIKKCIIYIQIYKFIINKKKFLYFTEKMFQDFTLYNTEILNKFFCLYSTSFFFIDCFYVSCTHSIFFIACLQEYEIFVFNYEFVHVDNIFIELLSINILKLSIYLSHQYTYVKIY